MASASNDAVYADPNADGPRRRLATALREVADPRGEFIELQLDAAASGKTSPATRRRIKELLTRYGDEWLADLDGILVKKSVQWARGFPVAGQLSAAGPPPPRWIGNPALATLERLDLWFGNVVLPEEWAEEFVLADPLRNLRELRHVYRRVLPRMLHDPEPRAIQSLELLVESGQSAEQEQVLAREVAQAFANGEGLPDLRHLSLSYLHLGDEAYDWLFTTTAGKRLESLRINGPVRHWLGFRGRLEASDVGLQKLGFFDRLGSFWIERTATGWTRITGKLGARLPPGWAEAFDAFVAEAGFSEDEVER